MTEHDRCLVAKARAMKPNDYYAVLMMKDECDTEEGREALHNIFRVKYEKMEGGYES